MANLLLVEDDASVRRLVTLQLSLVGYDVRAAEDAAAARALLADGAPDLAILDIMLPGEDGFSLAETMIEREIPVLFLTARTAVNDRVRGLRLGAEDYMPRAEGTDALCFWRADGRSAVSPGDEGRARGGADRAGI